MLESSSNRWRQFLRQVFITFPVEKRERRLHTRRPILIFSKPSIRNGNLKTRAKPTAHSAPACRQIISLRRLYKTSYRRLPKFWRTIIQSTMANDGKNGGKVVCVTGGGGYIGSWLVKNLLERGYTVHATLRDIGDEAKCRPLLDLKGAPERLKLFQADLVDEGSFDSAVEGCQGVFHVANPVPPGKENSLDDFVITSVNGVLNVMKACTRAKSVKRMVLTSSLSAASPLNEKGELTSACLDELCWSNVDVLGSQTHKGAWYGAAKTLEEQEALKYGAQNNLEKMICSMKN